MLIIDAVYEMVCDLVVGYPYLGVDYYSNNGIDQITIADNRRSRLQSCMVLRHNRCHGSITLFIWSIQNCEQWMVDHCLNHPANAGRVEWVNTWLIYSEYGMSDPNFFINLYADTQTVLNAYVEITRHKYDS